MAEQIPLDPRRWLIQLGKLTATRISTDEAADFVDTMLPMLKMRFPAAAFTLLSLEHVAAQCKYLPTFGEIVGHLSEWWHQFRRLPALPYEPPKVAQIHSAEERAHASWAASQAIAAIRSTAQPVEDRRPPTPRYLSREDLVRAYRAAGVEPPKRSA